MSMDLLGEGLLGMSLQCPLLLRKDGEGFGRIDVLCCVGLCWLKIWRNPWLLLVQFEATAGLLPLHWKAEC